MCDHEVPPTRYSNLDHLGGIVEPNRNRFLNEHMFSSFKRRDTNCFVQLYWQTDIYQVNIRIGEEVFNSIVSPKMREILNTAARTEISLNGCPIAIKFFRVASADRDDLGTRNLPDAVVMNHPHEADADNSDSYQFSS